MDRSCENCHFCIYAHSMRGKEEPYCKRHSKWIGDTLLCSEWEMVSVPMPQTNADRIRGYTDEELAEFLMNRDLDVVEKVSKVFGFTYKVGREQFLINLIGWLKEEA